MTAAVSRVSRPIHTASETSGQAFKPWGSSDAFSFTPICLQEFLTFQYGLDATEVEIDTLHTMVHVIVGWCAVSCEDITSARVTCALQPAMSSSRLRAAHPTRDASPSRWCWPSQPSDAVGTRQLCFCWFSFTLTNRTKALGHHGDAIRVRESRILKRLNKRLRHGSHMTTRLHSNLHSESF